MHTVKCPECGRYLTVPKPVTDARLRCRRCNAVFVGSSSETSGPAGEAQDKQPPDDPAAALAGAVEQSRSGKPAGPGGPGSPQPHPPRPTAATGQPQPGQPQPGADQPARPARKKNSSLATVIIIAVLLPLTIVLAFFVAWLVWNPPTVVQDGHTGEILYSGRDEEQIARAREELDRRKEAARQTATPEQQPEAPRRRPERRAPAENTEQNRPEKPKGITIPDGDSNVVIQLDPRPLGDDMTVTAGTYTAKLINSYDVPLRRVTVALYITDNQGRVRPPFKRTVEYVPADGSLPVSISFEGINRDDIGSVQAVAVEDSVEKADTNVVALEVDRYNRKIDERQRTVELSGTVENYLDKRIEDVKVICTFYDDEGKVLGTGVGGLKYEKTVAPDRAETFELSWNYSSAGVISHRLIARTVVRVWAKTY
ncbi:MAG: FxLYD domain-containing protein [Phycisphaerae bacterium]